MLNSIFDIEQFNIIQDNENYYFFRALNNADIKDIESGIVLNNDKINRIRTDRERYKRKPKYDEESIITLEEMFHHIKAGHRTDTNCISLSSNANVSLLYGRNYYKDKYVIVRVPKKELGSNVINAGLYMVEEIKKRINNLVISNKIDELTKYYLDSIDNAKTQEELNNIKIRAIKDLSIETNENDGKYQKGIEYTIINTNTVAYQALNQEQNFEKNKLVAKLDIIGKKIIKDVSNKFLIQTLGNAFSSLELIHYNDIKQEEIIEIPSYIVDIYSLLQQLPKNHLNVEELKQEIISYINNGNIISNTFIYNNYEINPHNDFSIDNIYNLSNGSINYYDTINIYTKAFYLAKSKLRTIYIVNVIKNITNNNPKYNDILDYILSNTYGIETKIFSKETSNKLNISESMSLDFKQSEMWLFNAINNLSNNELDFIVKNPIESLKSVINSLSNENKYVDKETYFAYAIIDLFDWSKLDIVNISIKQKAELVQKLKENNFLDTYYMLLSKNIKEKDISRILLTNIIKGKNVNEYDSKDIFTVDELEYFLGYYELNGTKKLKLRSYQATTLDRIDNIFKTNSFSTAILPTGAGKSFVALAEMYEHKNESILYLAPNDEILDQIADYIIEYIRGKSKTFGKMNNDTEKNNLIKEIFPNLRLQTYSSLLSDNGQEIIDNSYNLVIFDELHRTGADEWNKYVLKLIENQNESAKFLGLTATPIRDADGKNMADLWAKHFKYSNEDIIRHKHLAINMTLIDAIKYEYVVNPKIVSCEYSLLDENGELYNLLEKIQKISDDEIRNRALTKFDELRKKVELADGVDKVLKDNTHLGGKYIVYCPIYNTNGEKIENEDGVLENTKLIGEDVINKYADELRKVFGNDEIEIHSMLGRYSRVQNRTELEEFKKDNPNKIKFMLVMNKLNEGTHIDGLDGVIWYRPLDENSYILYHQQLGRIVFAIDPNNQLSDNERTIAIDLVSNFIRVNFEKVKHQKMSDLDKLNLIIAWISEHNGKIPDINSNDTVESNYGVSLKKIKEKYIKYVENSELINNISLDSQIIVNEIIELASDIDLWDIDFPDKIIDKTGTNIKKEDEIFELTGILRDYYELEDYVEEQVSNVKKFKMFIDELEEWCHQNNDNKPRYLWRLPSRKHGVSTAKDKKENEEQIESVLARTMWDIINTNKFEAIYKRYKNKMNLSDEELQLILRFEKIIETYNISSLEALVLELEEWCIENNANKHRYEYSFPIRRNYRKNISYTDKELKMQTLALKIRTFITNGSCNDAYRRYYSSSERQTLTAKEIELMQHFEELNNTYNIGGLEAFILELEEWCIKSNANKPKYKYSFPKRKDDRYEFLLSGKIANFKNGTYNDVFKRYYNGEELSEYERKIMEKYDYLETTYNLSDLKSFVIEFEEWCIEKNNGKPKYLWKVPHSYVGSVEKMSEKEKQEHRLSKRAIGILSDKYYNNIYGRFKDNDITLTNEEKELMTVFIQLYFKYNISNLEANILELEEWCHQNNDSKPRYLWKMPNSFRNLNSDDEKLKKETKLANFIRMLKTTSYYNNAYEKYYNGRYDELSVYELSSMQLFDSLIKKYDISKLESFILELEEWCRENNDGKPIYYYRMPRHLRGVYSAKDKLSENEDQREYRLHQTIQSFKRGVSFNNVYANYFDNNQKNNITPKEKELVERYLIIEKKYNYSQLELLIIDLEDFCNTYNRFPRGIHNITLTNKYFETELQREKRLYNAIINIKRGAYSNLYERYNNQILTQEELDFMNRFSELEKNYKNSVKIKVIKK